MRILGEKEMHKLICEMGHDFNGEKETLINSESSEVDKSYLYAVFLDSLVRKGMAEKTSFSGKTIWYSYYFWLCMYAELEGTDGGMEDYISHALEMMDHELDEDIDCDFLENMENVIEKNHDVDIILKIINSQSIQTDEI